MGEKNQHIYSHTALRGIAALSVMMTHFADPAQWHTNWHLSKNFFLLFNWANIAVNLFFILSGFILYYAYVTPKKLDFSKYLSARFYRILPLYYLTLILSLFLAKILHQSHFQQLENPSIGTLAYNALVLSGIVDGYNASINLPSWSISVEMFCYIAIFPLLYFLEKKFFEKIRGNLKLPIIGSLIAICTIALAFYFKVPEISMKFLGGKGTWDSSYLARGVLGFSIGFLICPLYQKQQTKEIKAWIPTAIVSLSLAILLLTDFKVLKTYYLILLLPAVVYVTAFDKGFYSSIFKTKPLQWLGDISYSLYLWHYPIMMFSLYVIKKTAWNIDNPVKGHLTLGVILLTCFFISHISFVYFETPLRYYLRGISKEN
jgi:peptidoglycan/LPS O-acetylase OafA/YrhL